MCFFCGGAGPETVLEAESKDRKTIKYTSKEITIKGKLKLNKDDINHLNFILKEAVFVKKED